MVSEAEAPERAATKQRIERYAGIRGALRALAPSTCFVESSIDLDGTYLEVRGSLLAASELEAGAGDRSELASLLSKIDAGLDALGAEARTRLRAIPLAQLRATLPERARSYPEEVTALLDLCLDCEEQSAEWGNLLDYVITLLATEAVDGRKRGAGDPVSLTPQLTARCEAALRAAPPDAEALAAALRMAREDLERGDALVPIVKRVRGTKRGSPETLFVPEVLRALVAYNVAVANRLDQIQQTDREIGDLDRREIESPTGDPRAAAPAPAPDGGSAFDSPGLRAIADALATRLASGRVEGGVAAQIAGALDVSKLAPFDTGALRAPASHAAAPVVRIAATLALLGRQLPDRAPALAQLGIDAEIARTRWVAEVSERIGSAMQSGVRSSTFDDARRLADARNRLLSGWGAGATMPRAEDLPTAAGAPAKRPAPLARPQPAPETRPSRSRWVRNGVLVAGFVGAAIAAGLQWWPSTPGVEIYSRARLETISSHLEAGYKDTRRAEADPAHGNVFIGRVGAGFVRLPTATQGELGLEIGKGLAAGGVLEVMLFDADNRLIVHWRGGELAFPISVER